MDQALFTSISDLELPLEEALTLHKKGFFSEALVAYQSILTKFPQHFLTHYFIATLFYQQKKYPLAISHLQKTIQIDSQYAACFGLLGIIHLITGEIESAQAAFTQALSINPHHSLFQEKLHLCNQLLSGIQHRRAGHFNHAIELFNTVKKQPDSLGLAEVELMILWVIREDFSQAAKYLSESLEHNPDNIATKIRLGEFLSITNNLSQSISYLREVLDVNPENLKALTVLLFVLHKACDWQDVVAVKAKTIERNQALIDQGSRVWLSPFYSMAIVPDPNYNLLLCRTYADFMVKDMRTFHEIKSHQRNPDPKKKHKIKIGYLSAGFKNCPNSFLGVNLFEKYNQEIFEVFAFSTGKNDNGIYRKRIEQGCSQFIDLYGTQYINAAENIYNHKIDILIDLDGYLALNYLPACALRPAPVQMHYLGFPGTLGAQFIDYFIADKIVVPLDHRQFFQEKIIYLPNSYQMNDSDPEIENIQFNRQDFSLPEEALVFCCFNNSYKISPETFQSWMTILKAVPQSVLWLWDTSELTCGNLWREAASAQVDPKRLIFSKSIPRKSHLLRLRLADIFLDTFICNAHTTASDALWAGIPVITLQGSHFASRVASSLLHAISLPELITQDTQSYESLAIQLATHPDQLKAIKSRLAKNCLTMPLFDSTKTLGYLEKAYQIAWENYLSGKKADHIEVMP